MEKLYGPPPRLAFRQWIWLCVNWPWHKVEGDEESMGHWLRENGFHPPLEWEERGSSGSRRGEPRG